MAPFLTGSSRGTSPATEGFFIRDVNGRFSLQAVLTAAAVKSPLRDPNWTVCGCEGALGGRAGVPLRLSAKRHGRLPGRSNYLRGSAVRDWRHGLELGGRRGGRAGRASLTCTLIHISSAIASSSAWAGSRSTSCLPVSALVPELINHPLIVRCETPSRSASVCVSPLVAVCISQRLTVA